MPAPQYDGVQVTIGGKQLVLPPMSAKTARAHWDRIQAMQQPGAMPLPDQLELTTVLVWECLRRNYPDLPFQEVVDHVDVANYDELSAMCFGRGAWLRWVDMQAVLQGNGMAPQTLTTAGAPADGTGAPSTPASPPPPAGDPETSTS